MSNFDVVASVGPGQCDICHRTSTWCWKCEVCGDQYCPTCRGLVEEACHDPQLCKRCAGRPDVACCVQRYGEELAPLIQRRRVDLAMLNRHPLT